LEDQLSVVRSLVEENPKLINEVDAVLSLFKASFLFSLKKVVKSGWSNSIALGRVNWCNRYRTVLDRSEGRGRQNRCKWMDITAHRRNAGLSPADM